MWNNQKQQECCFPSCQTYKPTIILNYISKKWKRRKDNQLQSLEYFIIS